jgi:4-aminobutyrate aminotransferase/(S)-3-amino-2-methylpropionate transaminase
VPPVGFLAGLRELCDHEGWLLIADEIYTGLGRTGRTWACDHEGVVPDLLCVGKGLASGMPISACVGRAAVMDAWPESTGEALHTQTFLGHPLGCAAALASIAVLEDEDLAARAARVGERVLNRLTTKLSGSSAVAEVRGLGLMLGVELTDPQHAARATLACLAHGVILLPSGEAGRVLSITPPLTTSESVLLEAVDIVIDSVERTVA